MGYYVQMKNNNFYIPTKHLQDAYNAMCELNKNNSLKRGGRWPRIESTEPNPDVYFSWMDWNYPETCENAQEVFEQLGFETELDERGLFLINYDNKSGQEDLFLEAIAKFVPEGSFIQWSGEDDAEWTHVINEQGQLVTRSF